jgi:hypothetical protein
MDTRQEILDRLVGIQAGLDVELISSEEIEEIRRVWSEELTANASRLARASVDMIKKDKA